MRLGLSVKIDVKKIDKSRLFDGNGKAKAKWLNLTTFIDTDNPDQYENHGFISQETTAEERKAGVQTPILGNVKVFFVGDDDAPKKAPVDEDIPF